MNKLIIYLSSAVSLFQLSVVVFGVLFRRDFREQGELSPLSMFIGSLVFFLWGGFPYIYGIKDWPAIHVKGLIGFAGNLLLFGGLTVMIGSIMYLGVVRSLGRQQTALVCHGPYRFSRNPQVIGVVMYGAGFALLWPSGYSLGWLILLLPMVHMMVLSEEEHLMWEFGEKYKIYCKRVPRYIRINL